MTEILLSKIKIMNQIFFAFLFRPCLEDQETINELSVAFQDNNRMRVLIGEKCQNYSRSIRMVISYCFFMVKKLGGIFTSKDKSTFLLFYRKSKYYSSIKDYLHYLYLAFFVVRIHRLVRIFKREKLIRKIRALQMRKRGDVDYLYVWFLAQSKSYKKIDGLVEAKNYILYNSKKLNLPIYIETTEQRLVRIYERIGFRFYDCLEEPRTHLKVWFGRYSPTES